MPESTLLPASAPASAFSTVADADLMREVAELVVSALNLDTAAADIQPDEPLYGEGLGLDSIDILEIALVLSKRYGLQLRADHEDNTAIFQSLRSLTEHIALQRSK
jgi:acyl carrier protein